MGGRIAGEPGRGGDAPLLGHKQLEFQSIHTRHPFIIRPKNREAAGKHAATSTRCAPASGRCAPCLGLPVVGEDVEWGCRV